MTLTNRKSGQTKEAPNEPLKRAVSGAMKAIARLPELEIVFAADKPSLVGERARLPEPPRKLTVNDIAILRGHADSMALRLACHDCPGGHMIARRGGIDFPGRCGCQIDRRSRLLRAWLQATRSRRLTRDRCIDRWWCLGPAARRIQGCTRRTDRAAVTACGQRG